MIKSAVLVLLCVLVFAVNAWLADDFRPDSETTGERVSSSGGQARFTSFFPGEVWTDNNGIHINAHGGGILMSNGVYYWFGEHKVGGDAGNKAEVGVRCYSSRDLYNWKDEGIALAVSGDPGSDIALGCILERPQVVHNAKTGKFVMWFHLELKSQGYKAARTAVAVADRVTGPYKYIRSLRPNAGTWPVNVTEKGKSGTRFARDFEGGQMARDMTVFVDDDGTAYHIHSSEDNSTLHLSELTPDYQDFTGKWARVFPDAFNEAPALFKRNGRYYMITSGCSGWNPNPARSAVADSIWGPWTPQGNPARGTPEQNAITFGSQSTHVLPVTGKPGAFIFMADRWKPGNAIDGRYVWLPIEWEGESPVFKWRDAWSLTGFDRQSDSFSPGSVGVGNKTCGLPVCHCGGSSPDLQPITHPKSIVGTPANRMIRRESHGLFIEPYANSGEYGRNAGTKPETPSGIPATWDGKDFANPSDRSMSPVRITDA